MQINCQLTRNANKHITRDDKDEKLLNILTL